MARRAHVEALRWHSGVFVIALEGPVNSLIGHGFFLLYCVDSLGSSPCRIACLLFGSHVDGVGTVLCSGCSSGLRIYLSVLAYWALARPAHVEAFCVPLWPGCGASWCPLALLLWLVGELAPLPFLFAAVPGLWVARWRVRGCT